MDCIKPGARVSNFGALGALPAVVIRWTVIGGNWSDLRHVSEKVVDLVPTALLRGWGDGRARLAILWNLWNDSAANVSPPSRVARVLPHHLLRSALCLLPLR